jgi:hypothetical protein
MDDLRKSGSVAPAAIAERLGVRYLLNGSVTKENGDITVNIELIDTKQNDSREMTETYHRQTTDIISLQRDITLEIVTALQVNLTEGEQERVNRIHGTRNLEAFLAAGRGEKLLRRLIQADNLSARSYYEEATADDPAYAGAWDGLAWTYFWRRASAGLRSGRSLKADESGKAMAMTIPGLEIQPVRQPVFALRDHAGAIAWRCRRLGPLTPMRWRCWAIPTPAGSAKPGRDAGGARHQAQTLSAGMVSWLLGHARWRPVWDGNCTLQSATLESRSPFALVELAVAYSEAGQLPDAKLGREDPHCQQRFSSTACATWSSTPIRSRWERRDPAMGGATGATGMAGPAVSGLAPGMVA